MGEGLANELLLMVTVKPVSLHRRSLALTLVEDEVGQTSGLLGRPLGHFMPLAYREQQRAEL